MIDSDPTEQLLSDVGDFHACVVDDLAGMGIEVTGLALSHVGVKTDSMAMYRRLRQGLLQRASAVAENVHNGRPIAKVVLAEPLDLAGAALDLVELMAPKHRPPARLGLEHLGIVVGPGLEAFARRHAVVVTERQDQGQGCQPACVSLSDGRRAKFYERSLRHVVEAEGTTFHPT